MKAVVLHPPGRLEDLTFSDVAPPYLATGDLLVRVQAAGITPGELRWPSNWVDRRGQRRPYTIPSREFVGEVVELGYGSTGFHVGDRVMGLADSYRDGAAAEFVAVETRSVAAVPSDVGSFQAAALPQACLTAWQGLFEVGQAGPGGSLLVLGAAGAVGSMAVHLAAQADMVVTAATRARLPAKAFIDLGASAHVNLRTRPLRRSGPFGLIFDTVGDRLLREALTELAPGGTVVSVVAPPPRVVDGRSAFFVAQADRAHLALIADLVQHGELQSPVGAVYPLRDGQRAFIDKIGGQVGGKVLISPYADHIEILRPQDDSVEHVPSPPPTGGLWGTNAIFGMNGARP